MVGLELGNGGNQGCVLILDFFRFRIGLVDDLGRLFLRLLEFQGSRGRSCYPNRLGIGFRLLPRRRHRIGMGSPIVGDLTVTLLRLPFGCVLGVCRQFQLNIRLGLGAGQFVLQFGELLGGVRDGGVERGKFLYLLGNGR